MRDIFSELIDSLDKDPSESSTAAATDENGSFALPESARPYISANIWDKITQTETPRHGMLLNALERVRSVLYLVSTYLPQHIVQQKMRRPISGHIQGREAKGTLLFSDVSGFTALSEKLAILGNEGAEKLTQIMNDYFEDMLEILAQSGGVLLKFAGDATLVYFDKQPNNEQALWAVRTGQRMMAAMTRFQEIETPLGALTLKMKIGISTGRFLESHIGSAERMEYVVIGPAVRQTMAAEGAAEAGTIVVDQNTANSLAPTTYDPHSSEFFVVRPANLEQIGSFEVKAQSRRARGGIPWNASPHAIATQMEVAARQIESLTPYLARELVDNIVTNARRRQIASEFRPTTVIFCNFIGFEAYLEQWGRHGPRRVAAILSQFFEAIHTIINSHGGVVTRIDPYSNGSKMLILFGAPTAHEDDPQRAASAAIAMQNKMAELNKEWQQLYTSQRPEKDETAEPQIHVQLKIGITHGRTFAGQVGSATRREYTVMGDDVNLSARLMSAAQPGQILINEPVFRAIENHFQTEQLEPIRVKGKTNPIPIFELRKKRTAQSYQDKQAPKPIFGRHQALAIGQEAIQKAIQGQGQHLQIQGTAGIGKSHLADAFYAQASRETVEIQLTYCSSFTAQSPYAAWTFFIRNLAAISETDNNDTASQKLAALLNRLQMAEELYTRPIANLLGLRIQPTPTKPPLPAPAAPAPPAKPAGGGSLFSQLGQKVSAQQSQPGSALDLSKLSQKQPSGQPAHLWQRLKIQVASRERARLFDAIFQLLKQLAAQKPFLLFFENAQWLDPASQALLDFISNKLSGQPILILSIYRELSPASAAGSGVTIPLGPLPIEGTAEMVNYLIGKEIETAVIEAIHTQSSGSPLFIREMVYWLERNRHNSPTHDLATSLKSSMTIQELILSRIDALPLEARETLKTAAIIGNSFRLRELDALLQQQKLEYRLPNALQHLQAGQVIARSLSQADSNDDPLYAFQQPLLREIVYNSQSFTRRRQSHRALAAYLEKKYQANIDQQVDLLAYHFEEAEEWARAGRYRYLAAHKARQRYAYDLAASTYGHALALLTTLPPADREPATITLMAQCHEGQGDMALLTGEMTSAAYAFLSAVNLLTAVQQPIPPEIQIKTAQTLPVLGRAAEAEEILRQLLNRPLSSTNVLAATATLAWLLWRSGQDEMTTWLSRARKLTEKRPNDPWAIGISALLTEWQGNLQQALEAYQTFEQTPAIILTHCRLGDRALSANQPDIAKEQYHAALKTAEAHQDQTGLTLAQNRLSHLQNKTPKHPLSNYQPYDDASRITLLFHNST